MRNLVNEFRSQDKSAIEFVKDEFKNKDGGLEFVDGCIYALNLRGKDLVWFCGMIDNYHYHYHNSYSPDTLIRTRKHFKKIALRYLNEGDYVTFKMWIDNWSNILILTNYIAPQLWENYEETERLSNRKLK